MLMSLISPYPGHGVLALLLVAAYFLGAIPFGVLIARARGVEITQIGSGNIGATNVHRVLGWKFGILVLVLDVSKGLIPPLVARSLGFSADLCLLAGFAAVLGHCASPFLGFKGGKGIATILGSAIGATPLVALGGVLVFAAFFGMTNYVSLASIAAVLSAILFAYLLRYDPPIIAAYILVGLFIIFKHRLNIRRLLRGEEPKTSFKGGEKRQEAERLPRVEPESPS